MINSGVELYLGNAAAMWRAVGEEVRAHGDHQRAETPVVSRILMTRDAGRERVAELLGSRLPGKALVIEDLFAGGEVAELPEDARVWQIPVMVRPAGPVAVPDGVRVVRVAGEDELAAAERVIVDGFPMAVYQPLLRGQALPPRVLGLPGWSVWLAYRDGVPAAAGYTFDDGTSAGLYWLATPPEHRGHGLGRALLSTAITAHPDRPFTLVATDAGLPLYESTGFASVGGTAWYTRRSQAAPHP
ncbi:GNAT superfamily N-acetyltransferase [Catenuloplanes nepalensis]|uniref:GNAT superfamily N-acetyltransferase n=1 Tax=Catenuloplanes nepalensis TaxID=587533 RepID=A0ABT9MTG9_9ACTN|nr:GNAT family N-acetyltransferase [Catenuloplanes nepalensis]MDP9794723.1 GNAT superfamily N-acetyltransferase [Catenuloplanes nepalensis]